MAVNPIAAAQQAPATTVNPEEEAQLAAEFESLVVGALAPTIVTTMLRQQSFVKQTIDETFRGE